MRQDHGNEARHGGRMQIPTELETLGRAFLAALVARLGHEGAAGVLMLLAVEMKLQAKQSSDEGRS
jgi:hypothetical protein